jgi:NAD(P)H-nitrite reductase large subunit
MNTDPDENPLDKLPPILKKDLNENLCTCNDVLKIDIINAIENGAKPVEEVQEKTYATDGNGCCKRQVQRLIECLHAPETK